MPQPQRFARVAVPPPGVRPRGYGLYSVAQVTDLAEHGGLGVEYQPDECILPTAVSVGACDEVPEKLAAAGTDTITGDPLSVYAALSCVPMGSSVEELRRRATVALTSGEEPAVEEYLWTVLAAEATDLSGGSAVSLSEGLAVLENALGAYGFGGNILSTRGLSAMDRQVYGWETGTVHTRVGTQWAYMHHPDPTPGPAVTPAGAEWMYAAGPIVIHRGEIFTPGDARDTFGWENNTPFSLAERVIVPTVGCPAFAVLIESSEVS